MCKHCERIKEHPEDRQIVHDFMERTCLRLREMNGMRPLHPDDIEVTVEANFPAAPIGLGSLEQRAEILRMLDEMHK